MSADRKEVQGHAWDFHLEVRKMRNRLRRQKGEWLATEIEGEPGEGGISEAKRQWVGESALSGVADGQIGMEHWPLDLAMRRSLVATAAG